MISCLLIQEMIISDIDKKRKLGFLLSRYMRALFYWIKRKKSMLRVILNEIISLKNQQNICVSEDEEGVVLHRKKEMSRFLMTLL